jgi:protein ImuB
VPACALPPRFEAGWSAEHPTARRETIGAALEWLIARVAAMLARCGRGALRLDCRLVLEINNQQLSKGDSPIFAETKIGTVPNLPLSVGLFQPTADAKRLFELVELQLERLRIGSPVTAIHVAASLTAPLEPRKQATLFELDGDANRPRRLAALVERLGSRLGSGAVVGVRLRPEAQPELSWHYDRLVGKQRRRKQMPRPCNTLGGTAGLSSSAGNTAGQASSATRPLRLLPHPLPLAVTSIAPNGPPLRFAFEGQEHAVARSWGPERIETGWWRGRAVGRDYFRVETAAASRFWLFRRLRDGRWFLHGTFE